MCTLIGPFCAKYTTFDLNKYNGAYFMTLTSHAKFGEKMTCGLEDDMRNLVNFHQNTWKCQNWYFHGILLSKVENAWAANLQRNYKLMTLKNDEKSEEELTCRFKIDMGIWRIFTRELESLKNFFFNGLLLSKLCNVWAKKVQWS